jgi:catechol 2,3-dioxygenase-like lactoylglutathione lyase family enzyme
MFTIDRLDHIVLRVTNMSQSIDWYQRVLGFERRYADVWDRPVMLVAGQAGVALFDADPAVIPPNPPLKIGFSHFAMRVDRSSFEQAQAYFTANGITFEYEDHTVCYSIYLYDPDGYRVELTTYEV